MKAGGEENPPPRFLLGRLAAALVRQSSGCAALCLSSYSFHLYRLHVLHRLVLGLGSGLGLGPG